MKHDSFLIYSIRKNSFYFPAHIHTHAHENRNGSSRNDEARCHVRFISELDDWNVSCVISGGCNWRIHSRCNLTNSVIVSLLQYAWCITLPLLLSCCLSSRRQSNLHSYEQCKIKVIPMGHEARFKTESVHDLLHHRRHRSSRRIRRERAYFRFRSP